MTLMSDGRFGAGNVVSLDTALNRDLENRGARDRQRDDAVSTNGTGGGDEWSDHRNGNGRHGNGTVAHGAGGAHDTPATNGHPTEPHDSILILTTAQEIASEERTAGGASAPRAESMPPAHGPVLSDDDDLDVDGPAPEPVTRAEREPVELPVGDYRPDPTAPVFRRNRRKAPADPATPVTDKSAAEATGAPAATAKAEPEAEKPDDEAADQQRAFRSIGDVAREVGVPQHVLRFWETKFSAIQPLKRGGGRRLYRPEDVALVQAIRILIDVEGHEVGFVERLILAHGGDGIVTAHQQGKLESLAAEAVAEAKKEAEALVPERKIADTAPPADDDALSETSFAEMPISLVRSKRPFVEGPDLTVSQRERLSRVLDVLTAMKIEIAEFRHMREQGLTTASDIASPCGGPDSEESWELDALMAEHARLVAEAEDADSAPPKSGEASADRRMDINALDAILPQVSRKVPD